MSKFIDEQSEYWGPEFADILGIEYNKNFDKLVHMGAYTMLYEIADNFRNGEFREEILEMYGVQS